MNISTTIIPKSDQINADDLIGGPRTYKIESIESGTAEQPVNIFFAGEKRAYRPSKSMRRVLVALWGPEAAAYIGQRVTLYREPGVKFGGEAVGGIRISHASGISDSVTMALTEAKGRRKPYRVEPLPAESGAAPVADLATLEAIGETKSREGADSLRAWWSQLPASEAKKTLASRYLPSWKDTAKSVDEAKGTPTT